MSDATIRPFVEADTDRLYEICLRTGAAGRDASGFFADPRLLGEVWVGPYLRHVPQFAFVVEDAEGVGGYVLGAADTGSFDEWAEASWWPTLRARYPRPSGPAGTADELVVGLIHTPSRMPAEIVATHPAHLHIDLLPRLQRRGHGRRLLDRFLVAVRAAGAEGVHLGVSTANSNAIAFYDHLGFAVLAEAPDELVLGRSTESLGPRHVTV